MKIELFSSFSMTFSNFIIYVLTCFLSLLDFITDHYLKILRIIFGYFTTVAIIFEFSTESVFKVQRVLSKFTSEILDTAFNLVVDIMKSVCYFFYLFIMVITINLFCCDFNKTTAFIPSVMCYIVLSVKLAQDKSNILYITLFVLHPYFSFYCYPFYRQLLITFISLNYSNKDLMKGVYTMASLFIAFFDKKLALMPAFFVLILSIGDIDLMIPPRFFKKYMIMILENTKEGGKIMNDLLNTRYSNFIKCNPCISKIEKMKINSYGTLTKTSDGDSNKGVLTDLLQGFYNFYVGEIEVSVFIDDCGVNDCYIKFYSKDLSVKSLSSVCLKKNAFTFMECLNWYKENPKKGVYLEHLVGHCLNFKEIFTKIILEGYSFKKVEIEEIEILNLGVDHDFKYVTEILKYKNDFVKVLLYHNNHFFNSEDKEKVIYNLLENKAALGEKGIGSSVYKRYCSEVNNVIEHVCGVKKYIKLVKPINISSNLRDFLGKIKKVKSIKKETKFKDTKAELHKRLIMSGRSERGEGKINVYPIFKTGIENKKTGSSELFDKVIRITNEEVEDKKEKSSVIKKSYSDAVKEMNLGQFKDGLNQLSYCLDSKKLMIPIPKYEERESKVKTEQAIGPLEVYNSVRGSLRLRDIDKIEKYISENQIITEEENQKFKRLLYSTRKVGPSSFIKKSGNKNNSEQQ